MVKSNNEDDRIKTDKSLEYERLKTDEHLGKENQIVEDQTDESVQAHRSKVDSELKFNRDRADVKNVKDPNISSSLIEAERTRSDKAQVLARNREDRIRISERDQKRLIAEALLEDERRDTDIKLHDERSGIDKVSHEVSLLVSNAENALITRDQYLAIVSHDLKNPLSAVSLNASNIKRALSKNDLNVEKFKNSIDAIERNVAHMDRMISDLLDVERMGNGQLVIKRKTCNVVEILNECKELFAPAAALKSFKFLVTTDEDVILGDVDDDRIIQVLSNLIGNALKFTPAGGTITLSAKRTNNGVKVCVLDTGPGIPDSERAHIFERFSQLKVNDRRGLGLGLFISKWIIEAHHGEISVVSRTGEGSNFSFTIPDQK